MGKKVRKKRTKRSFPVIDIIKEALKEEESNKGLKEILNDQQYIILNKLNNNTLEKEERWIAYVHGFNASEIARYTGYTRANISERIRNQTTGAWEDVKERHRKNREDLKFARGWYLFVYLSDKAGDYCVSKEYVPKSYRTEGYLYRLYKKYGGKELEPVHEDKRHKLPKEKRKVIEEALKTEPIEKVAFQERVYLSNIEKMAEENGWKIFYEEDIGESEYTEKLNTWMEKKKIFNQRYVDKFKKE